MIIPINHENRFCFFRVFFAIAFSGLAFGQASTLLPDYAKAQLGAGHIYKILDAVPAIDSYSEEGSQLVSINESEVLKPGLEK